jgi:hypothetical protein
MPRENSFQDFIVVCAGSSPAHPPRTLATFSRQGRNATPVWDVKGNATWDDYGNTSGTNKTGRLLGVQNARAYESKEHDGTRYHRFECPRCKAPRIFTDEKMAELFDATRRSGRDSLNVAEEC